MPENLPTIEKAFEHIEAGNRAEANKDHWVAATSFGEAVQVLTLLQPPSHLPNDEQQKISTLYHNQAVSYLQQARKSFISALGQDTEDDVDEAGAGEDNAYLSSMIELLSDEDKAIRLKLFSQLFTGAEDEETIQEKETDLMKRLEQLNQSFPKSLATEEDKIRDLNRGLRRMGLGTIPGGGDADHHQPSPGFLKFMNKSAKNESDQVADIIAQAKDEVELGDGPPPQSDDDLAAAAAAGKLPMTVIPPDADEIEDASLDLSEGTDDDEDSNEAVLTKAICEDLHSQLVDAQVKLSELVALFEVDEKGNAEIEFDQQQGKKLLRDMRRILQDVSTKWSAC